MKKVFVDIYLQFNLGDDLFLDILAQRYPNSEFTVNYLGKNYDRFISKYGNVSRRTYTLFNKIEQRLKLKDSITNYDQVAEEHDALLFIGGSIFREEEYHESLYRDRLKMITVFKRRHKPVFILGANFGPVKTEKFLNDYKQLFEMCDDVCFRDDYSYSLFKDIPQVRYAPDIVFQMDTSQYSTSSKKDRVGFSIIDVNHKNGLARYEDEYVDSSVKAIETLVRNGHECCLMSFCEIEGDLEVIEKIQSTLTDEVKKKVIVYEYKGNLEEAITLIASFALFVAARFHANILAMKLGVGLMPVIYSEKTVNMLQDNEFADVMVTMENLQLQYSDPVIRKAFTNILQVDMLAKSASEQFQELDLLLKSNKLSGIV